MEFIAILKQDGEGCDYSIGCGINYEIIEAENREEAKEYLHNLIVKLDKYEGIPSYYGERRLRGIILAELLEEMPIEKWNKEMEENIKNFKNKEKMDKELKELERLQKKYGRKK